MRTILANRYGAPDPELTASLEGFVNAESLSDLDGTLVITRVPGEALGEYLITPGGLTSSNYGITFHSGTLTISATPAPTMLPLAGAGTDEVTISWNAVSGVKYRVQYTLDLNGEWLDLASGITVTNSVAGTRDQPAGAAQRFYRVTVP